MAPDFLSGACDYSGRVAEIQHPEGVLEGRAKFRDHRTALFLVGGDEAA